MEPLCRRADFLKKIISILQQRAHSSLTVVVPPHHWTVTLITPKGLTYTVLHIHFLFTYLRLNLEDLRLHWELYCESIIRASEAKVAKSTKQQQQQRYSGFLPPARPLFVSCLIKNVCLLQNCSRFFLATVTLCLLLWPSWFSLYQSFCPFCCNCNLVQQEKN